MGNLERYTNIEKRLSEPVRDPLWKHIYLSKEILAIAGSAPFQKTARIKQLGPTFYTYPGATHTRMGHSFGVYEIARQILKAISRQDNSPDLSEAGMVSFLDAALLHDIGHFPYTHSLKDLPLKDHEVLSGEIILETEINQLIAAAGGNAGITAEIIDTSKATQNQEVVFYRKILSGVLDPDKLDYLNRDAFYCGVPYGIQDKDFIIDRIVADPENGLAIDKKGIQAVENILFSKYLMYKSVYWHKTVRNVTATVKKVLIHALESGFVEPEQLYRLDDFTLIDLLTRQESIYSKIIDDISKRHFFSSDFEVSAKVFPKKISPSEKLALETKMLEALIGRELAGQYFLHFIIDIPEKISFETNLRFFDHGNFYPLDQSDYVFSAQVIQKFQDSLQKIRFFYSDELKEIFINKKITNNDIFDLFKKMEN
ncbi:MAG: HD domain-containing protein [Spirochaetales bacterium]|nr:HD domain-containing protein [Spirochaetales bacterium]